jgi:hypothetical protein
LDIWTPQENVACPQIYDFQVNPKWHQLTLYNGRFEKGADNRRKYVGGTVSVELGRDAVSGGVGLDPNREYYLYDFWADKFLGKVRGNGRIERTLEPGECAMISIHEREPNPQFISTSRHVIQGYVDMVTCEWDAGKNRLMGVSRVVGGEPYEVVIAANGLRVQGCSARGAQARVRSIGDASGLLALVLESPEGGEVAWDVSFEKEAR